MRWTSEILVVDVDTGEIISQYDVTSGKYIIESKDIKHSRDEKQGHRKITWFCKRNQQTEFKFE